MELFAYIRIRGPLGPPRQDHYATHHAAYVMAAAGAQNVSFDDCQLWWNRVSEFDVADEGVDSRA